MNQFLHEMIGYYLIILHTQEKQLTQLYIFISACFELSLYSWIAGLDDGLQLSELFPSESVQKYFQFLSVPHYLSMAKPISQEKKNPIKR